VGVSLIYKSKSRRLFLLFYDKKPDGLFLLLDWQSSKHKMKFEVGMNTGQTDEESICLQHLLREPSDCTPRTAVSI